MPRGDSSSDRPVSSMRDGNWGRLSGPLLVGVSPDLAREARAGDTKSAAIVNSRRYPARRDDVSRRRLVGADVQIRAPPRALSTRRCASPLAPCHAHHRRFFFSLVNAARSGARARRGPSPRHRLTGSPRRASARSSRAVAASPCARGCVVNVLLDK